MLSTNSTQQTGVMIDIHLDLKVYNCGSSKENLMGKCWKLKSIKMDDIKYNNESKGGGQKLF